MKIFLFLMLMFYSAGVHATECAEKTFHHKHLEFYFCQNTSSYSETRALLYEQRAKELEIFIADLITEGKLSDKKVFISLYDAALSYDYISVTQSKSAYNVSFSGFKDFEYMANIIYYFTQANWKSYDYDPEKVKDRQASRKKFESIVQRYQQPNLKKYTVENKILWKNGNYSLRYHADSINYFFGENQIAYKANANLPAKIKSRFLFLQDDGIFADENGKQIATELFAEGEYYNDCRIYIYNKWVNFGWGPNNAEFSYSFAENKFYKISRNK